MPAHPAIVAPGQAVSGETRLFAGAKEKRCARPLRGRRASPSLRKSIDWGWFEWFMRPIFSLLQWLFHVTGNFGVAIICLTFIVRGADVPDRRQAVPLDGRDAHASSPR